MQVDPLEEFHEEKETKEHKALVGGTYCGIKISKPMQKNTARIGLQKTSVLDRVSSFFTLERERYLICSRQRDTLGDTHREYCRALQRGACEVEGL